MFYFVIFLLSFGCMPTKANIDWLNRTLHSHFSATRHHYAAPENKQKAMEFIEQEMKAYGLTVERQLFSTSVENVTGVNVIGLLKGSNFGKETDVISGIAAHYDTMRNTPGVNDNGAGVVAMLRAAKLLSEKSRENTILFFAFDFEEWEEDVVDIACTSISCGSRALLEHWLPNFFLDNYGQEADEKGLPRFLGTLVMDTVINFDESPQSQALPEGFQMVFPHVSKSVSSDHNKGDFIALVGREDESTMSDLFSVAWHHAGGTEYELETINLLICNKITPEEEKIFSAFVRSDHVSFWRKGLNAVFLTDTANYRGYMKQCYHAPCDTISMVTEEKLEFLEKIAKSLAYLIDRVSPVIWEDNAVCKAGAVLPLVPVLVLTLSTYFFFTILRH